MMRSITMQMLALTAVLLMCVGCTPKPLNSPPPAGTPIIHNPLERSTSGSSGDTINRSCKTNADCVVKNVGNCCGYYPACVNSNATVNPEGVMDVCRKSGTASVCGFPSISGCQCVSGSCQVQPVRVQR